MHVEYLSNGMGSQSQAMLVLAARKIIPATVSITADTGAENDCLVSDGRRMAASDFFSEVILPYSRNRGVESHFYRVRDKDKNEREGLGSHVKLREDGVVSFIPVFGYNSKTGRPARLLQSCTERFKVRAVRQCLRSLGAKSARGAEGLHVDEVLRRARGEPVETQEDGFLTLHTDLKWLTRYYPLATLRMTRQDCEDLCREEGLPWVVRSQCEFCPHQDYQRWKDRSEESIQRSAEMEASWEGKWFLTSLRKPLREALEEMAAKEQENLELDFGCDNDVCGI